MKTVIGILLILGLSSTTWAGWGGEIYGSKYFNGNVQSDPANTGTTEFENGLEIGYIYKNLRPFMSVRTRMDERNGLKFHPSSVRYEAGITIRIPKTNDMLYLDLIHSCDHPVDQGGRVEEYNMLRIRAVFGDHF